MKISVHLFIGFLFFVGSLSAQVPSPSLVKSFGSFGEDISYSISIAPNGEMLVSGYFSGTLNLGNGVILQNLGDRDGFVMKLDATGNALWARTLAGSGSEIISDVVVDGTGNIAVVGEYTEQASFAGQNLTHSGMLDGMVALLSPNGDLVFAQTCQNVGDADFERVAFLANGGLMAFGKFTGDVAVGSTTLSQATGTSLFFTHFTITGDLLFAKKSVSSSYVTPFGIIGLPDGGFACLGTFGGNINFGNNPLVNKGLYDCFLVRMDAEANPVWSTSFGGPKVDDGFDLKADESGNFYVAGSFNDSMDVAGTRLKSNGLWDTFLLKFDATGQAVWAKSFGSTDNERCNGIALDANGNINCFGWFKADFSIEGTPFAFLGGLDIYLVRYAPSGQFLDGTRFGNAGLDAATGIDVDQAGNLFLTGSYTQSIAFGSTSLTSVSSSDVFLVKLGNLVGIESLQLRPHRLTHLVYSQDGQLQIHSAEDGEIFIYDLTGRNTDKFKLQALQSISLPFSIGSRNYIFQSASGKIETSRF